MDSILSATKNVPSRKYNKQYAAEWGDQKAPVMQVAVVIQRTHKEVQQFINYFIDTLSVHDPLSHVKGKQQVLDKAKGIVMVTFTARIDRASVWASDRGSKRYVRNAIIKQYLMNADWLEDSGVKGWAASVNAQPVDHMVATNLK
jgi:hypothetical protein